MAGLHVNIRCERSPQNNFSSRVHFSLARIHQTKLSHIFVDPPKIPVLASRKRNSTVMKHEFLIVGRILNRMNHTEEPIMSDQS